MPPKLKPTTVTPSKPEQKEQKEQKEEKEQKEKKQKKEEKEEKETKKDKEKTKIDRLKKYPSHYIAIKKNFPFVKRNIINKLISKSFIERATVQDRLVIKIIDVLRAFKYAPFTTIKIILKEYLKKF